MSDLVKEFMENPNLTKEWVKKLLNRINGRVEKLNGHVGEISNRLSDNDKFNDYADIIDEFDIEYSTLQEDMVSFQALFLES